MEKINSKTIIELTCRLYVFFFLFTYGFAKIVGGQFYSATTIPDDVAITPIVEVTNFDLAWTFMGRSLGYMIFLGISEILGAVLLLFNKTKLLGALILITILVNVIIFDIFFLDQYGALFSASLYLFLLSIILYLNKENLLMALKSITENKRQLNKNNFKNNLAIYLIVAIVSIFIFFVDQMAVNWLGHGKGF